MDEVKKVAGEVQNLIAKNPYNFDSTIGESKLFFGREILFNSIKDKLNKGQRVILLFGNRKIGKSSVLKQIPIFFRQPDRFVFVNFDLQDKAKESLGQILYLLACEICEYLVDDYRLIADDRAIRSLKTELKKDSEIFSRHFLPQVFQELGDKKLVLLLDEFDVFSQNNAKSTDQDFFSYIKKLIEKHDKLCIIPVVGLNLSDLPKLLRLFNDPPMEKIDLLDEENAKRLITEPAKDIVKYDPDAIKAIFELSAGHPYFILVICFSLFRKASKPENSKVSREDVESVVDRAIELAEGGLSCFWDELSIPEQIVFSAVAEAQATANQANQELREDPLTLLQRYGVIEVESLIQAANQLTNRDFLDNTQRQRRVKIELVSRWLVKRHPLRQEIRQLKELE